MLAALSTAEGERLPETIRPEREMPAPAFCAAASACAMKGRALCLPDERMRPGRIRKSFSPVMAETPHIASSARIIAQKSAFAARYAENPHLAKIAA